MERVFYGLWCVIFLLATSCLANAANVNLAITNDWRNGFQGELIVENSTSQPLNEWAVSFDTEFTITNVWNGQVVEQNGGVYTLAPETWNSTLAAGTSTSMGFVAEGTARSVSDVTVHSSDANPSSDSSSSSSTSSSSTTGSSSTTSSSSTSSSGSAGQGSVGESAQNNSLDQGRYVIFSRHSGLALDVQDGSTENGANVIQWDYNGGANQQFDVVPLADGYYSIQPVHSGKSLDVWNWSTENGGEIRQYDYNGGTNQQWEIRAVGEGYYQVTSRYSGKVLDVWNDSTANGGDIRQYDSLGGANQQWRFQPVAGSPEEDYSLVWADEFDYTGLPDSAYWNYEEGMVRNNEAQYYTVARGENAWVENGLLTITARRESYNGANYTSASLNTSGKQQWTYGRFEMRARLDARNGLWPAFWMLGNGKWPESGEVDIMEYYANKILANVAWKANNADAWSAQWDSASIPISRLREQDPNWDDKFHVWRMDWDSTAIRLYVDDLLVNETLLTNTLNPDGSNPFIDRPMYLLVNLAIGGDNGGNPANTAFPATYEIDYVRVYQ